MSEVVPPAPPVQLVRAQATLGALGALFLCVDPAAWNSMGRPTAASLGHLMYSLQGDVVSGLEALGLSREA